MKAVRVLRSEDGSRTSTAIEEVPVPSPGAGEMLVKIRASAVQPADILNSKGGFPATTCPRTLGKDFAGTVVSGPDDLKGRDVYGTSGAIFSFTVDGAQAEYAVVPLGGAANKPVSLSFAQAASLGTPFTTAAVALERAETQSGDVVMVLGATGAVGSAVMQIARAKSCRTVSVGRHRTDVNSMEDPELSKAREMTGGKGPDVVVDTVGDFALTKAAFDVLADNGRLSIITAPRQGSTELAVDFKALYRRQIKIESLAGVLSEMSGKFEAGELVAPQEEELTLLPVERAMEAYDGKAKKAVIMFEGC